MKFILAPMATLSHEAFRLAVDRFGGCDEYFTEMINAGSLINRGPFEKYYLLSGPRPEKIVWQLTGNKTDSLAQAAKVVATQGGIGVDLNMGCSAPQIYKYGSGISWMLKPVEETAAMVRAVKKSLDEVEKESAQAASQAQSENMQPKTLRTQPHHMRLSVKLRLGDDDFTEEGFFSFCDMLVNEGVEMITLHPRTKKQKYRIPARWEYVEKLALHFDGTNGRKKIPIILNGDIYDKASFYAAIKTAPHAAGVMIARAAAQKPWIFSELNKKSESKIAENGTDNNARTPQIEASQSSSLQNIAHIDERNIDAQQLALDFIDDVEKYQPAEFHKTRLQRFFAYYCMNFSFAHYFQTQMLNAKDNTESRERVKDYFARSPADRFISL